MQVRVLGAGLHVHEILPVEVNVSGGAADVNSHVLVDENDAVGTPSEAAQFFT